MVSYQPTRAFIAAAVVAILHIVSMIVVDGFSTPSYTTSLTRTKHSSRSSSFLQSTEDGQGSNEEARRLKDKANQYRVEAEKLKLTLCLKKIDALETEIREFVNSDKHGQDKLQELKDRVEDLVRGSLGSEEAEKMLSQLATFSSSVSKASTGSSQSTTTSSSSDNSLSPEEIKNSIALLDTLPIPAQDTLAKAAGYASYNSILDIHKEDFVQSLYENRNKSTEELRRLYGQSFMEPTTTDVMDVLVSAMKNEEKGATRAMELFPRTVQDIEEGILPTEEDADAVFQLLDRSFMATEKPIKGNGGYIIKGANKRKTSNELLDYIDGKLKKSNPQWSEKFQVSLVEIYSDANEELFEDALLITPNKFPPLANKALSIVTTAIALFSSVVFCIGAFSENEVVMARLKEATELAQAGGSYDVTWFNALLIPLLATLGSAQGVHEAAHYLVAWSKQVKLTSPTILPALALPYLSFQNRIKTSPKGYADLFDIAFVGPFAGLSISFIALLVGLQMTTTVDSDMTQLLPSLPVGYLTQSTLGGTIVDLVLGGGDGILINQDPTTQIPLHPVAIGGFLGLIIHALDLVPVGSTDGGRMSQAILGRVWHLTFSSLVFLCSSCSIVFSKSALPCSACNCFLMAKVTDDW